MKSKRSKAWLYFTVFFTSSGVFVSQIILSIILGFHFNYDFRFISTSLAILGLGIGGVVGFLFREKIKSNFPNTMFQAKIVNNDMVFNLKSIHINCLLKSNNR